MNLTHLRHLLALADNGSFRAAAKQLNISQSALTKSIKALEQEFQLNLVSRGSHGSHLTIPGLELLSHARSICSEVEIASAKVREFSVAKERKISIGTLATASIQLLPECIRYFQARYPGLKVTITIGFSGFLVPRLLEGHLDLVIGSQLTGSAPAGVKFSPLFSADYCVVARKGHRFEGARSLAELDQADWIVPIELSKADSPFHRAHAAVGLKAPRILIQSDCPFFLLGAISKSDCLGLFRPYLIDQNIMGEKLSLVELKNINIEDHIGVFSRTRQANSLLIEEIVSDLETRASRMKTRGSEDR